MVTETKKTWSDVLHSEKEKPYFQKILKTIDDERAKGETIYPAKNEHFEALKVTPFDQVKVVLIGQDPYHGPNQAHGLCFSVKQGCPPPPSLKNIMEELHQDCHIPKPAHGCLMHWAHQGVLLLNTVLSVRRGHAHSHANIGWEIFTDAIIHTLNQHHQQLVFILWGSHAQKKAHNVDPTRHFIIKSVHPSPLSAHRGFFGSKPFSKTNDYLSSTDQTPIDWHIK